MKKSIPTLAAAFLMTAIATPVLAQAAIQEPGAYSFYHPNADVLNGRPSYRSFDQPNAYYNSNAYYNEVAPPRDQQIVAGRDNKASDAVALGAGASAHPRPYPGARLAPSNFSPNSASSSLARSLTAQ